MSFHCFKVLLDDLKFGSWTQCVLSKSFLKFWHQNLDPPIDGWNGPDRCIQEKSFAWGVGHCVSLFPWNSLLVLLLPKPSTDRNIDWEMVETAMHALPKLDNNGSQNQQPNFYHMAKIWNGGSCRHKPSVPKKSTYCNVQQPWLWPCGQRHWQNSIIGCWPQRIIPNYDWTLYWAFNDGMMENQPVSQWLQDWMQGQSRILLVGNSTWRVPFYMAGRARPILESLQILEVK